MHVIGSLKDKQSQNERYILGRPSGRENPTNSSVEIPSTITMSCYNSPQIDQDQETKTSCTRPSLLCSKYTREGELCVCANERNSTSIYTHNLLSKICNPKRGCFDFYNKDNNKIIISFELIYTIILQ